VLGVASGGEDRESGECCCIEGPSRGTGSGAFVTKAAIGVLASASSSDDPPFEAVVLSSSEGDRVAEVEGVQSTFFLQSRVGGGWLCRLTVSLEISGHPGYAGTVNGLNTITGPVTSDAALTAMPMKTFWAADFDRACKDKHKDQLASAAVCRRGGKVRRGRNCM
jgi:hypothetical protein